MKKKAPVAAGKYKSSNTSKQAHDRSDDVLSLSFDGALEPLDPLSLSNSNLEESTSEQGQSLPDNFKFNPSELLHGVNATGPMPFRSAMTPMVEAHPLETLPEPARKSHFIPGENLF